MVSMNWKIHYDNDDQTYCYCIVFFQNGQRTVSLISLQDVNVYSLYFLILSWYQKTSLWGFCQRQVETFWEFKILRNLYKSHIALCCSIDQGMLRYLLKYHSSTENVTGSTPNLREHYGSRTLTIFACRLSNYISIVLCCARLGWIGGSQTGHWIRLVIIPLLTSALVSFSACESHQMFTDYQQKVGQI